MGKVRIAVAGAGVIGLRHIEETVASPNCELSAIVDPGPKAAEVAQKYGVPLYRSLAECFAKDKPEGIVLATPNQMHVEQGLECIKAGVPCLVEKPIGAHAGGRQAPGRGGGEGESQAPDGTPPSAQPDPAQGGRDREVGRARAARRRDGQRRVLQAGSRATSIRRTSGAGEPGGGPILINMIHEVGNLRALMGEIVAVQAFASNATRKFEVEDTVAINLEVCQRRARHVPAVGHGGVAQELGADVAGEQAIRDVSGRGRVRHHRQPRLARRPDDAPR